MTTKTVGHTPGPWRYCSDQDGDHAIWGSNNTLLAVTDGWTRYEYQTPRSFQEDEANARLIAAAPAMLEALQELLVYLREFWPDEPLFTGEAGADSVLQAEAAIRQAEEGA